MSDSLEPLKSSIVRFYHANGNVVGAGFLVAERYVLTCAHVVAAALSVAANTEATPEQLVQLDFPLLAPGSKVKASVVFWWPVSDGASSEDMAMLKLLAPLPANAESVSIAPSSGAWGHPLRVFGFPRGYADGVWATATLRGETGKRWIQLDAKMGQDRPLEQGFSGSPIWDEQLKAVVGMTVAAEKDKQQSVTLAYMMPKDVLRQPLNSLRQQTLEDILSACEPAILSLIQRAYSLCRYQNAVTPVRRDIHAIIDELANTTAGAEQEEDKLVQFAAALALELDAQQMETPGELLQQWGSRYAKDFDAAKAAMGVKAAKLQQQKVDPHNPMLLVRIQKDVSQDTLSVEAWLVLDPDKYDVKTLQGTRRLLAFEEENDRFSEHNISYDDLPVLIESYLMQLCDGYEYEYEPNELDLYFVLSPALLNKPIERMAFGPLDELLGIGSEECPMVTLAIQNRSELASIFAKSRWRKAWKVKEANANVPANQVFSDGQGLKNAGIVGLRQVTSLNLHNDPILLADRGIPLALWVRDNQADVNWEQALHDQVLSHKLKDIPKKVLSLRRNTEPLDSETDYAQSSELGHHLAILWDDPKRVPPPTNVPLSAAKL